MSKHLSDAQIAQIYDSRRDETHDPARPEPEFTLEELIGDRIIAIRNVATTGENPGFVRVIDLESGRSLVIGSQGCHDYSLDHYFLINSDGRDRYAEGRSLFNADDIERYCPRT